MPKIPNAQQKKVLDDVREHHLEVSDSIRRAFAEIKHKSDFPYANLSKSNLKLVSYAKGSLRFVNTFLYYADDRYKKAIFDSEEFEAIMDYRLDFSKDSTDFYRFMVKGLRGILATMPDEAKEYSKQLLIPFLAAVQMYSDPAVRSLIKESKEKPEYRGLLPSYKTNSTQI